MTRMATVRAAFKQAVVKGERAVLTFEVLTSEAEAFDIIRMSGKTVELDVTDPQSEIVFVNGDGEVM